MKTGTYDPNTGEITYVYTVTNIGDVNIYDVIVDEDGADFSGTGTLPDPAYFSGGSDLDLEMDELDLAPWEVITFTSTYTVTPEDIEAGVVINQATATGTDPEGLPVADDSDESSPFTW